MLNFISLDPFAGFRAILCTYKESRERNQGARKEDQRSLWYVLTLCLPYFRLVTYWLLLIWKPWWAFSLSFVGIKESDTGLAPPSQWDLVSDKQMMQEEQPLQVQFLSYNGSFLIHFSQISSSLKFFLFCVQVARCTKIISPNTEDAKYVINVKQIAKVRWIPEPNVSAKTNLCVAIWFVFYSWFCFYSYLQFVVGLGEKVSPTDIEEGMRVG